MCIISWYWWLPHVYVCVSNYLVRGTWYGYMHSYHADTIPCAGRYGQPTELEHFNNHYTNFTNRQQITNTNKRATMPSISTEWSRLFPSLFFLFLVLLNSVCTNSILPIYGFFQISFHCSGLVSLF